MACFDRGQTPFGKNFHQTAPMSALGVRRDKAALSSGANPKHQQPARESENLGGRQASRPAKSLETFAYALTMRRRGPAQTRISAGLFLAVAVTSRACQRRLTPRVFQLLQLTLARL